MDDIGQGKGGREIKGRNKEEGDVRGGPLYSWNVLFKVVEGQLVVIKGEAADSLYCHRA